MPVVNGRGYSQYHTPKKQELLTSLIKKTCGALRGIHLKHPQKNTTFHWVDAYAGPGYNTEVGCNGSPLIFQETVRLLKWPYLGYCIDKEVSSIRTLESNLKGDRYFSLYPGDCAEVIPEIFRTDITGDPYGILYMDNNGAPDFKTAGYVSGFDRLRHMDFVFHLPATSVKRNYGAGFTPDDLYDKLMKINKTKWFICSCHPVGSDAWQWVMILGTNYMGWKGLKSLGFYEITSSEGEAILNFVNHNKRTPPEMMKASQKPLSAFIGVSS